MIILKVNSNAINDSSVKIIINSILNQNNNPPQTQIYKNILIAIILIGVFIYLILFIIGICLSFIGGQEFYEKGYVFKMILGIILTFILPGAIISYVSYKNTKKSNELKKRVLKL